MINTIINIIKKIKINNSDWSNREFSFYLVKELKNVKNIDVNKIYDIILPFTSNKYSIGNYWSIKINMACDLEKYIDLYYKKNKTPKEESIYSFLGSEYITDLNHYDLSELEVVAEFVNPKYYQDIIDIILDSHYLNLSENTITHFKRIIRDKQKQLRQKK